MFFTRNRFDCATLSGGSWLSTLPLNNLKDRRLSKVARTADDAVASTKLLADLGAEYYTRLVSVHKHNLSLAANVRVRLYGPETFARADTATYVDEDGVVTAAASGELRRWHYLTDNASTFRRCTLLERAYTNLIASDDFDAGWTSGGTPVVTTGISDPAGGTTAYRIADDDGAGVETKRIRPTFTGNGVKGFVWVVREATKPAAGNQALVVYDDSLGANRLVGIITAWTSGTPTASASTGTYLGKRYVGNGYWEIYFQSTSITAASNNDVYIYPAVTSGETGSIDVYRVMAFNDAVPPASILSASDPTTADSLTIALNDTTPKAATYLYEGVVLDLPNQQVTNRFLFDVGSGTGTSAHLYAAFENATARLFISFGNGSAEVTGYWTVSTLALGDNVLIRITQASDGAITCGLTINGGTEDTTLDSAIATQALPTAWANDNVRFSGSTAAANCNAGLISFKAQSGSYTTAQMQALVSPDIAYYGPYDSQWVAAYPDIYPTGSLDVGDPGYTTGQLAQEDLDDGYVQDFYHVVQDSDGDMTTVKAQYLSVEFSDTANADSYVEAGRVWCDYGYQPTVNMVTGSGLGWQTSSTSIESDGGEMIHDTRPIRRIYDFAFETMGEDESLVQLLEINRRLGTTGQLLFVTDPDDTYHMHRRAMLATLKQLSPLKNKVAAYYDQAYQLTEEL